MSISYTLSDLHAARDAERRSKKSGRPLPAWYARVLAADKAKKDQARRLKERQRKRKTRIRW